MAGYETINGTHDEARCHKCLDNQYIIDPDLWQCEKCPPGLICRGDDVVIKVVANSTWLPEDGVYKLKVCLLVLASGSVRPSDNAIAELILSIECCTANSPELSGNVEDSILVCCKG